MYRVIIIFGLFLPLIYLRRCLTYVTRETYRFQRRQTHLNRFKRTYKNSKSPLQSSNKNLKN